MTPCIVFLPIALAGIVAWYSLEPTGLAAAGLMAVIIITTALANTPLFRALFGIAGEFRSGLWK